MAADETRTTLRRMLGSHAHDGSGGTFVLSVIENAGLLLNVGEHAIVEGELDSFSVSGPYAAKAFLRRTLGLETVHGLHTPKTAVTCKDLEERRGSGIPTSTDIAKHAQEYCFLYPIEALQDHTSDLVFFSQRRDPWLFALLYVRRRS